MKRRNKVLSIHGFNSSICILNEKINIISIFKLAKSKLKKKKIVLYRQERGKCPH